MLNKFFKSIAEQDTAPIVICDTDSVILYMNPAAINNYHRDLTGMNLKDCHNAESNKRIDSVLSWFKKSKDNNIVYTFYNEKKNKDVYMVALRGDDGGLIGYYEKHELRNRETGKPYDMREPEIDE